MGARGPKPMSARAHLMRGNPSKKPLADLQDEVQLLVEIPDCPKHLWPEARREWKRAGAELEEAGFIAKVDRAEFAQYCQAWAELVWHEEMYKRSIDEAAIARGAFEKAEAEKAKSSPGYVSAIWTGGDGLMIPTPNGSFMYNPHWVAKNKASDRVSKFAASFNMAGPASRVRALQSNNYWLPGMEPNKDGSAPAGNNVKTLADFRPKA